MLHFSCPTCGKKFAAKDELAGKQTKCPQCQQALTVPDDASEDPCSEVPLPPPLPEVSTPAPQRRKYKASTARRFVLALCALLVFPAVVLIALWAFGYLSGAATHRGDQGWVGDWEAVDGPPGWKDNIELSPDGKSFSFFQGRMQAGGTWDVKPSPDKPAYFIINLHSGQVQVTARLSEDGQTLYTIAIDGKSEVPFRRKATKR